MIAYLKGKVLKKTDKGIILDTGNIGYFVNTTNNDLSQLKENQEIEFFIHSHIREDSFDLYGMQEYKALEFFRQLINVSGIGPKVALETLNQPLEKIQSAINNEDIEIIKSIPGIGKKTAQRLVLELKGKITVNPDRAYQPLGTANSEATEALITLGYQKHHIHQTLSQLPQEIIEAEAIITYFLKNAK